MIFQSKLKQADLLRVLEKVGNPEILNIISRQYTLFLKYVSLGSDKPMARHCQYVDRLQYVGYMANNKLKLYRSHVKKKLRAANIPQLD